MNPVLYIFIPGLEIEGQQITNTSFSPNFNLNFITVGGLVNNVFRLGILIAGAVFVFWLGWGVFQYIFSGGSKERLNFARKRIIFAILGFVIVLLAYNIQQYVSSIFETKLDQGVKNVSTP